MAITFGDVVPWVDNTERLIDAEFQEMPGMRLTAAQVRRLCNLSDRDCRVALVRLCETGQLVRDASGRYFRERFDY